MAEKSKNYVQVKVRRHNTEEGKIDVLDTYDVPIEKGWNVVNILLYINEHYDGGLAHYLSCCNGSCKGCVVKVNGKPKIACLELVNTNIILEPISERNVIKDLVVE